MLAVHGKDIAEIKDLSWLGRLSLDNRGLRRPRGGWVDETSELRPSSERGRWRVAAGAGWLDPGTAAAAGEIFRLAGIYGAGRGPFETLRAGTAKRIDKPGQVFSRIHVEDLAQVLAASISLGPARSHL